MNKRPVAFRVPRLCGDMVSHYFVTTSEDEARAMADTNQVEYEGLYLVGDRFPAPAQGAQESILYQIKRRLDGPADAQLYDIRQLVEAALAAQPPAAPVERETCGTCMGSGYSNHPDSGEICANCNGSGGVAPQSSAETGGEK